MSSARAPAREHLHLGFGLVALSLARRSAKSMSTG
jgi:hypothetical protein